MFLSRYSYQSAYQKDKGIIIEKLRPKTTELFSEIISKLEERTTPRWTEIGVILNRFSPEDQLMLSSYIKDFKKIVNRTWEIEGHKNIIIYTPPTASEYALTYVLYKDANADRKDEFIEQAAALGLEPDHVNICLVISKNTGGVYLFVWLIQTDKFTTNAYIKLGER